MKRLALTTAILLASTLAAAAEGELQLYNWGGYTSPELLEKFEKETGIKVTVTEYTSNDAALAKVLAGGHGFDLVVPSANYVGLYVDQGLTQTLDLTKLPNHKNIAPEWLDVAWDPGRTNSIPWAWGTTGIAVDTAVYGGDINTSAVWIDPPDELKGKINVFPEMSDVITLATLYYGGQPCSEDPEVMKKVRDGLMAAKPHWIAMDYGMTQKMIGGEWAATLNWNGSSLAIRESRPTVAYGYPKEGFILWMDSVMLLKEAQNVEEAYAFLNFIMAPENAGIMSNFYRSNNGITGSQAFMNPDLAKAPEVVVPEEHRAHGQFMPACSEKARDYMTAIWTELQK